MSLRDDTHLPESSVDRPSCTCRRSLRMPANSLGQGPDRERADLLQSKTREASSRQVAYQIGNSWIDSHSVKEIPVFYCASRSRGTTSRFALVHRKRLTVDARRGQVARVRGKSTCSWTIISSVEVNPDFLAVDQRSSTLASLGSFRCGRLVGHNRNYNSPRHLSTHLIAD